MQPEDSQGICSFCIEELKVSFNFKKRCLEIFANVFDNPNQHHEKNHNEEDDGMDFMDSILDQSLHEEDASINLNDLLIPEVCLGNTALSALDITDQSKCRYCFKEFSSKEECQKHLEEHKGDDKPYKCPHEGCDSRFKARKNLKDHYLGELRYSIIIVMCVMKIMRLCIHVVLVTDLVRLMAIRDSEPEIVT